jgi:hypothetical protein
MQIDILKRSVSPLVQNWSEIVDFMNQNVELSRRGSVQVSVLADPDSPVPAIRIERSGEPRMAPRTDVDQQGSLS